jgi:5-methyltetrahydropteroyltriglutamate--homocysteine methyltransferase
MGGRGDQPGARRRQGKAAVHLCFGNYGGQSVQKGSWSKLIAYLNSLHVDHIVMENAHRPAGELAVFRDLRPEIGMGLGVIDVKRTEIESPDDVARAIEQAEQAMGAGRIRYVHPDCGFWMLSRTIADGKIRSLGSGTRSVRRTAQEPSRRPPPVSMRT